MKLIMILITIVFLNNIVISQTIIVNNNSPKYPSKGSDFISKYISIDITDHEEYYSNGISDIDTDDMGNIYIFSFMKSEIIVFDKSGKFIKKFGRSGQGPKEIERSSDFTIFNSNIYIYEHTKGMKVWDLNGNYIKFILNAHGNSENSFLPFANGFYASSKKYLGDIFSSNWKNKYLLIKYSSDFKKKTIISKLEIDPHKVFAYNIYRMVPVDSNNNTYYPSSPDEYIINKFNEDGINVLKFGRKLKPLEYSLKVKKFYKKHFEERVLPPGMPINYPRKLPKHTPYVRHIIVDDKDFIWVILGEWSLDINSTEKIKSKIDIFNKFGEFLYTFESDIFSSISIIRNNKIYTPPNTYSLKGEIQETSVNVYKVDYFFNK